MISPLRYPGGKAKLFDLFVQLIQDNDLYSRCYTEPYAGGAGLALKLLGHGYVDRIELNDIDPAIHSFWRAILKQTDEFCRLVVAARLDVEEWKRQRDVYRAGFNGDHLELGFAAYYLNRTSRSGIIEGSGPIGGYSQAGVWKIDARFNQTRQVMIIQSLAKFSDSITISNEDALEFLGPRLSSADHFVYLDPPYYVKGRKLYKNFYKHDDHARIAALLSEHRQGSWVVSYDHVYQIRDLYRKFTAKTYQLHYSAGPSGTGEEVMFCSDVINLPEFPGFKLAA